MRDHGRNVKTKRARTRVAFGFEGSFADDWRYTANFTSSEVGLTRVQNGYQIPQRIMNVAAQGSFNFYDPYANARLSGTTSSRKSVLSVSRLWQVQGTIARDLMELSGGSLQAAIGASYRYESINAPSGNPANDDAPYTRYYG